MVVFNQNCASCHNFNNTEIGPNLAGITGSMDKDWIKRFIQNPQKMIQNGDVRVKYVSLENAKGINIFSFLDFLKEKKYDKWFTIHQPLLEDQKVEIAIENVSKLFLQYKV